MVLKNIQIHLHTYSSLEGNRWLVAQQNCPEIEQMVVPVQNDLGIGTNRPESLLGVQLWPWSGGGFPLGTRKWVGEAGQKGGCEQRAVPTQALWQCCWGRGSQGAVVQLPHIQSQGKMGPPVCEGARIQNQSGPRSLRMHPSQSQGSLGLKGLPLADSQKGKKRLPL